MTLDIATICKEFQIKGKFIEGRLFGNGHLHDTYRVEMMEDSGRSAYILQRINHYAFRNPGQLMDNLHRVTAFIRNKLETAGLEPAETARRVLTIIPGQQGDLYYLDAEGQYWRMFHFITGTCSHDIILDHHLLYQAAFMMGDFLQKLADLPEPALFETIPDFHNGARRLLAFEEVLRADSCFRAGMAREEIDFVWQQAHLFSRIPELLQRGELALRPTHNDTKVNNVLLDEKTGMGMCVIDLDTTMPGVSLYDFGDLARTTLSTRDEDERDLDTVFVEMPRFKTILEGYLAGAGASLSLMEKKYLVFSTKFMPMIIGLRFLTDYLQGDVYFKTHRTGHNLERCRRQFKLVRSILEKETEMEEMVAAIIESGTVPPAFGPR